MSRPAWWDRASLCAGTARRDWDTIAVRELTTVTLRDRTFPAEPPGAALRSLAAWMATPYGRALTVYTVQRGDVLQYWTTHRPSAEEYALQHPGTVMVDRGRKADALVMVAAEMVRQ